MESDKDGGLKSVKKAQWLIKKKFYTQAKYFVEKALEFFPDLDNGFEMLVVCETLYYGNMNFSKCGIDWYSVLHLSPLSNDAEVKTQCEFLIESVTLLEKMRFPGAFLALVRLNQAKSVLCDQSKRLKFDSKRKEFGFYDGPISSKPIPSKEGYLDWKPPISVLDVTMYLQSRKKPRTNSAVSCSCADDVEVEQSASSPELKNQVFDKLPQNPHYLPLQKYTSKVREGMMLGLDLAFVKLSEEIRNFVDPKSFLLGLQGFTDQLAQLEEMGYNVEKLRERLDTLQRIAERDRSSRVEIDKFEAEVKDKEAMVTNLRAHILELEAEIEESKVLISNRKRKIEVLKEDSTQAVKEFESMAKTMWK